MKNKMAQQERNIKKTSLRLLILNINIGID